MKQFTKYVGMDVHKATVAVSVAESDGGEVRYLGEIANTPEAIAKMLKQLRKGDPYLAFCYEAGPCGYGIHRQLTELGWDCQVVAPSLFPSSSEVSFKPLYLRSQGPVHVDQVGVRLFAAFDLRRHLKEQHLFRRPLLEQAAGQAAQPGRRTRSVFSWHFGRRHVLFLRD